MVKTKLVKAIHREVRVGDLKPTIAKIVAEKYMREFCKELLELGTTMQVAYERLTNPHSCCEA